LAQKEDLAELQKAFKALDKNADGKLTKDELVDGYRKIYGEMAEDEVDKILARVDANGSGEIDYSGKLLSKSNNLALEWVVATINKEKLLSTEKLKQAFTLFDKDGSGAISSEEVKEILCAG
jgi:calcium-dependent protein kinase